MTRVTFMVIVITLTLTGLLPAKEVKAQRLDQVRVSLNAKKATLNEVLTTLSDKSGFNFVYTKEIGKIGPVNLLIPLTTLDKALKILANDQHLRFDQINGAIAVSKMPLPPPPGSIKGRVVEFETSEPLPGASIRIVELNKGISSDEKGYYHLDNIPPGKYTLEVSFVGYEVYRQAELEIKEGKELTLDVKLKASNNLSEVVIKTRQARSKQAVAATTDKELLTEIRQSVGVVSGISSEQISKSADRNAAEVVKRISGVTVTDDRFIIVRGMSPRYNLTYLNDNIAPTTELYNKAFAYDLLPSSIIDRILVYKSPQADLLGDFAGGAVKVYTKNTKPVRHLDIGIQLADRPGSTLTTINSYQGGKFDFLGFDDGSRKLPSYSPSYFQTNPNEQNMSQAALLKGFSPILDYGTKHSLPDMQLFANYYDNWKIGSSRLYDLTSINYTHETRNFDVHEQTGNTYFLEAGDSHSGEDLNENNQITNSQQTTEIGKVSLLENLSLKLNSRNQLQFKNFFVNEGRVMTTINDTRRNIDPHLDTLLSFGDIHTHNINLSFQQRLLYSGNLGGQHDFDSNKQHLDWNLGYTYTMQNVPDQRNSTFYNGGDVPGYYAGGSNENSYDSGFLGMINRMFIKLNENAYNFSADYTLHKDDALTLKAGTYQLYKTREVGRRFFRVNRAGLAPDELYVVPDPTNVGWSQGYGASNPNLIFFQENYLNSVWNAKNFPADGSGLALYDVTSPVDSYVASEQNNAGYIMGDWKPLGSDLSVNAGLRVEYDRQIVSGATGNYGGILGVKVDHPKTSFLPSLNINYRPDSAYVVRLGYGRTVNRPDFRELAPYNDFDFQNSQTIVGNPAVTSATIDNYDFRMEFYPESAQQNEVFNAGVFYKNLSNPIEQLRDSKNGAGDLSNFTQITFGNAISARVYGIEAEVRKSLSFIPLDLFRNISVLANASFIKSSTREPDLGGGTFGGAGTANTSINGRPLQGQSPYVINAGLYYENAASGTKISLIYNVNGPSIYAKSTGNPNSKLQAQGDSSTFKSIRPDLLQLPQQLLDISITQRIVKSLQMKFSIQNLLNQQFRIIEDQNYNQKYDPEVPHKNTTNGIAQGTTYYTGDDIFERYNPGRYFILQFTYAF